MRKSTRRQISLLIIFRRFLVGAQYNLSRLLSGSCPLFVSGAAPVVAGLLRSLHPDPVGETRSFKRATVAQAGTCPDRVGRPEALSRSLTARGKSLCGNSCFSGGRSGTCPDPVGSSDIKMHDFNGL
jgi:hypothetical protein